MNNNFASRAGDKLAHALMKFKINVAGKVCADFGCSTGGFTDCLLQNGAQKVYAIDTAYGQLDWNLRNDERVIVMERTNALHVELPEKADFISVDVSWTPQRLIIPNVIKNLKKDGVIVSLIKPHYEAPKEWLRKGKLLPEKVPDVIKKVEDDIKAAGIKVIGLTESPIVGKKGANTEYLMCLKS